MTLQANRFESRKRIYVRKASLSSLFSRSLHYPIQNFVHLCNPSTFPPCTSSSLLFHAVIANYLRGNKFLMIVVRPCLIDSRGKRFFFLPLFIWNTVDLYIYMFSGIDILDEESMLTFTRRLRIRLIFVLRGRPLTSINHERELCLFSSVSRNK